MEGARSFRNSSADTEPAISHLEFAVPPFVGDDKDSHSNKLVCAHHKDNLDVFFCAISSTMRRFPPLQVAKLKLEISNLVGAAEVAMEENQVTPIQVTYLVNDECVVESNGVIQ